MARCEDCSQKIPSNQRFCGEKGCVADEKDWLPRCILCGNIATNGMKDCITSGGAHQSEDDTYCTVEDRKRKIAPYKPKED